MCSNVCKCDYEEKPYALFFRLAGTIPKLAVVSSWTGVLRGAVVLSV